MFDVLGSIRGNRGAPRLPTRRRRRCRGARISRDTIEASSTQLLVRCAVEKNSSGREEDAIAQKPRRGGFMQPSLTCIASHEREPPKQDAIAAVESEKKKEERLVWR
ncbi:hypothetical protein MTO96_029926 [Rhipicephalus appendiculatus]